MIEASFAWEMATASGISIAILDSGVDSSHPDLVDQIVQGWNSVSGNTDTVDINGHGTKVAGTAAATTNNGIGVAAIGWNANIMPVRITNRSDGWAYVSDIANGLTWAADNGAHVANISYNVSNSSSVTAAAQYMQNMGGLVVAAAGNNGSDPGWNDNPAIISVSATSSSDTRASFSNYGSYIDVAAPGVGIRTTAVGGGYSSPSGTSFASPATAGLIALILGANPGLSPEEVESILESSADDLVDGADWHAYYGHGRINAARAVETALYGDAIITDTEVPTVTVFSPSIGDTVSGLVPVDVAATDNVRVKKVALYAGDDLIGIDYSSPYQFSWDSNQSMEGNVVLTAIAQDPAGNEAVSDDIAVLVDNDLLPTVLISEPADGITVNHKVWINVNGQDDILIDRINLYIDGQLASSISSDSLAYQWNTHKAADGFHTVKAEVVDSGGNIAESSIQLNVSSKGNGKGRKNR